MATVGTRKHHSADYIIRKVCPDGHCPSVIVEVDLDDPQSVMRGLTTLAEYLTVKRVDTKRVVLMVRTAQGKESEKSNG